MNDLEELRWKAERFTFQTPDDFERRRGEKWIRAGTRNHGHWAKGIQREVRVDGDAIAIDDRGAERLQRLIIGRSIVGFEREPHSGEDWSHGENSVTVLLDDGSLLRFIGFGYDSSGLDTFYSPPES